MCESTAYFLKDGTEEPIVESVETMEINQDQIKIVNLFGEQHLINARVKALLLVDHKIILEPL